MPVARTSFFAFQFTPLREGRRLLNLPINPRQRISIHAPPRGATADGYRGCGWHQISIHAPPRGATARCKMYCMLPADFNSRPSARGDELQVLKCACPKFQFTPLREGRPPLGIKMNISVIYFNSRPSARGDLNDAADALALRYFNSRPSARGDRGGNVVDCQRQNFNSRPSARGDPAGEGNAPVVHYFNSRPSARGDVVVFAVFFNRFYFNSRPSARGDPLRFCSLQPLQDFNSRPSARGDGKRYAISANLLFNPYKSAWLNNSATQFVEIILVIFHRIIA